MIASQQQQQASATAAEVGNTQAEVELEAGGTDELRSHSEAIDELAAESRGAAEEVDNIEEPTQVENEVEAGDTEQRSDSIARLAIEEIAAEAEVGNTQAEGELEAGGADELATGAGSAAEEPVHVAADALAVASEQAIDAEGHAAAAASESSSTREVVEGTHEQTSDSETPLTAATANAAGDALVGEPFESPIGPLSGGDTQASSESRPARKRSFLRTITSLSFGLRMTRPITDRLAAIRLRVHATASAASMAAATAATATAGAARMVQRHKNTIALILVLTISICFGYLKKDEALKFANKFQSWRRLVGGEVSSSGSVGGSTDSGRRYDTLHSIIRLQLEERTQRNLGYEAMNAEQLNAFAEN